MTTDNLLTVMAGVLVALPGAALVIPDLNLTPEAQFALLVLSLVGGAILKLQPGSGLSDADVQRIAAERERLRRQEIARVRAAGEQPRG